MDPLHLRSAGTSLVISFDSGEAEVIHWGADLGATLPDLPSSANRSPTPPSTPPFPPGCCRRHPPAGAAVRPFAATGSPTAFRPRLLGPPPRCGRQGRRASGVGNSAVIVQSDPDAGITVASTLTLHDGGLLEMRHTVTNTGTSPYQLDELATVLPVAPDAVELLDLTGRWCRERHPQRRAIQQGTWVRTGPARPHRARLLAALAAGTAGFGNRHGKVWATHLAWSGNHEQFADSIADGRTMIGGSELLGPAEVVLHPAAATPRPRSSPPTRTAAWTASAKLSTPGSGTGRTTCCPPRRRPARRASPVPWC